MHVNYFDFIIIENSVHAEKNLDRINGNLS